MIRRPLFAAVLSAVCIAAAVPACKRSADATNAPVRVAAASDLTQAFQEVGQEFEKQSGRKVEFSFGSSGLLAKQLSEGAPYDVFASANAAFVDDTARSGACDPATKAMYARGRLVVWVSSATGIRPPSSLAELTDGRFAKIAIANPEHAPYGRAARQALERSGLWDSVSARIVYGENVMQTLQFAKSGNAEAAIVALSLARGNPDGVAVDVNPSLHDPLDQALVVCKRGAATQQGKDFALFVNSERGRAIMKRFGFVLPSEAATASAGSL